MKDVVIQAIAAAVDRDAATIAPEFSVADLGIDSLMLTSVAAQVTAACGNDWSEEQLLQLFTASDVQEIVEIAQRVATQPSQVA